MLIYFPVNFQTNICHYIIKTASGTPSCSNFRHRLSYRHGNSFTQCMSECPDAEFVVLRFLNSRIQTSFPLSTDHMSKAITFRRLRQPISITVNSLGVA